MDHIHNISEEDIVNIYAEYMTSIIELELFTAGYTILNINIDQVNIITNSGSNTKTIQINYKVDLEYENITFETLNTETQDTKTQTSNIIVSITDFNIIDINYDQNVEFPDDQYTEIIHNHSEQSNKELSQQDDPLTLQETNAIISQITSVDGGNITNSLSYLQYGINSPLYK